MVTSLLMGVNGIEHVQTRAFVGGKSLHPLQRMGAAPVGLGVIPPVGGGGGFGNAPPAAPTRLGNPPTQTFAVNDRGAHV